MHIGVEPSPSGYYGGHDVYIEAQLIGHRPYDGTYYEEIRDEVRSALAELLRKELGWDKTTREEGA